MSRGPVLVTGAAGRLGVAVTRLLVDEGYDLIGTDVRPRVDDGSHRFEQADLVDHREALRLLDGVDAVVHLGNRPHVGDKAPQLVFDDNVAINENVFQAAAEQGVERIVFASTLQLIGSHVDGRTVRTPPRRPAYPLHGGTPADPSNVYALSKAVSETMLRYAAERCGLVGVALRFPLLHHGEERFLVATGDEGPDDLIEAFTGLTYDDAAAVVLAALRADLVGYHVYVAATSHRHRDLDIGELIRRHYPEVPDSLPDLVDHTEIERDLGWRPGARYLDRRRRDPHRPDDHDDPDPASAP